MHALDQLAALAADPRRDVSTLGTDLTEVHRQLVTAVGTIRQLHAAAAAYVEENDRPGEWLDSGGSWKDWESEAEGSAAEAKRDALADVLAILNPTTTPPATTPSERARAIGEELAATDAETVALNESLTRDEARRVRAVEQARTMYETDDVRIGDETPQSVDGGYWVSARVWVDADDAEPIT